MWVYAVDGLKLYNIPELVLDFGCPNQVPSLELSTISSLSVRYLKITHNDGNGCCKELIYKQLVLSL